MKSSSLVTFRKVHGRIVPIRQKESRPVKALKGVGTSALGVGVGVSSGAIAGFSAKKAVQFQIQAKTYTQKASDFLKHMTRRTSRYEVREKQGQMKFHFKLSPKKYDPFTQTAVKSALTSKSYRLLRRGFKVGGLAASSALIGEGLKKTYEGITHKKAKTKEEVISRTAGAGAAFALSTGYTHSKLGFTKKNLYRALKVGLRTVKIRIP